MSQRKTALLLPVMTLGFGVWVMVQRGVWAAAPLFVIAASSLLLLALAPLPSDLPGRRLWAAGQAASFVSALAAAWGESAPWLLAAAVGVVVTALVPWLQARRRQ